KIVRDALADEERPRFLAISRGRQDRIERVLGEVDRNVCHVRWKRAEPLLLHVLGGRMVRLEDSALRDLADSMGPAVEAGAQDHNLLHALTERLAKAVVDVPSSDRYRSARAGPVPVDKRPRHGSADQGQAGEAQRRPEAPVEKPRGEGVVEESRRRRAGRLDGSIEANERGRAAHAPHGTPRKRWREAA